VAGWSGAGWPVTAASKAPGQDVRLGLSGPASLGACNPAVVLAAFRSVPADPTEAGMTRLRRGLAPQAAAQPDDSRVAAARADARGVPPMPPLESSVRQLVGVIAVRQNFERGKATHQKMPRAPGKGGEGHVRPAVEHDLQDRRDFYVSQ